MKPDTWAKLDEVFFRALELPTNERAAYLDQACGDDAALRREIDAVLAGHAAAGGTRDSDRLLSPAATGGIGALTPGARIGAYAVDAVIGRGGMGEVYRARRDDAQYEQQVAIKVMRAGRDTDELMRRFRTERQILARLQHPNIATLLDGGMTDQGHPYLVMQFVDGRPLTQFANDRSLDLHQRLRLFVTVADAVQFAHANLVVHRDLKPSNILVTADGEVRLLDFGIAKILDPGQDGSTTGDLLLLTPEHAAPEQFLGATITTATDVYALGVLLYELLTGSRPFQSIPAVQLHQAVCTKDPMAPSVAAQDADWLARAKLARSPVAADRLIGDLDAIVLKSLRKEPARRYTTAAEMADDVRRHLNGFPVVARPDTAGYVIGRYLRRHKVGVAASLALGLTLLVLAIVSFRFAVTSRAQTAAIAAERDVALRVSTFLETLFRSPTPFATGTARRDTMRVKDLLLEGAEKVRTDLATQPEIQARLLSVIGVALTDLGSLEPARAIKEEALAIRHRVSGPDAVATAVAERQLATVLWQLGKLSQAESLARRATITLGRDSIQSADNWIKAQSLVGNTLIGQGRFAEAEPVYRRALGATGLLATDSSRRAEVPGRMGDLAATLDLLGRYAESDSLSVRAIALEKEYHGPEHIRVANPLVNYAVQLMRRRRFAEAEPMLREAVAIQRARLPNPHPRLASGLGNLGAVLLELGRLAAAESLLTETVTMQKALYGPIHQSVGTALINLAGVHQDKGEMSQALALRLEAKQVLMAAVGPEHPNVAYAHQNLGVSLAKAGRHREAHLEFERAVAIRRKRLPPTSPLLASSLEATGSNLLDLGRAQEAEPHLQAALTIYAPLKVQEARQYKAVTAQLARLYRATGDRGRSARFQAMADSIAVPAQPRP